ncbi:MAG: DNA mismatch repair protein MutS [Flavobacteriaceae bacterium]|nr:DNA mismatch repair protein MutS [Flavobacteriaceae bacterium]
MQDNPILYYTQRVLEFKQQLKAVKRLLYLSSFFRFAVFLATCFAIYITFDQWKISLLCAVIGVAGFVFLLLRHLKLAYKRDKIRRFITMNQLEIDVLKGDISKLSTGEEFVDPSHFYSYDIDLFGANSLFQYMNRTATSEGKQVLANLFTSNTIDSIEKKQQVVSELSEKGAWRQNFTAIASMIKNDTKIAVLNNWLTNYTASIPGLMRYLPNAFSLISMVLIVLFFMDMIPDLVFYGWFFFGLGISSIYLSRVNSLSNHTSTVSATFSEYSKLIACVETANFETETLKKQQEKLSSEILNASEIVQEFSKLLAALDSRNNIFIGLVLNGFFLWDVKQSFLIEAWIEKYHSKVADWFDVISFFDAQNSLGNYVFNHPQFHTATIDLKAKSVLKASKLGHPLLKKEGRVDNDFSIDKEQFFIVTGANMAGKSTFLRTVSLSIVLCNMGLPICAEKAVYSPIKLITSMRTSDSLAEGSSYFFAELQRLKIIVEAVKVDRYFIILDEILKGTNSHDKALGSKKIVRQFSSKKASGIIATHDLSLCELSVEISQVENYYFDAEIIKDELFFGYKLKKGICTNMNASFLLKKMKIVE